MATARKPARKATKPADGGGVDALVAGLSHPKKDEIAALREILRGIDPAISESVKWSSPSFASTEHFATFHLRDPESVQIILHLGAKSRPDAGLRRAIPDPAGLLEWRGADRAIVTFRDLAEVVAKREALADIVRQWLPFV